MQAEWQIEVFNTCELGVNSGYEPDLIPQNQLAWLKNGRIRGGRASTRPTLTERLILPSGKIQGVSFFSIQQGMLVVSIDGRIYRVRVNNESFSYESISGLAYINSPSEDFAWMVETVGSLVIQDGQSQPIIYDGSTARRADPLLNEVPLGRMMAFGNGRLWVAINTNEVVAGDIKTKIFQSELLFTESQYFSGGGAFYFPFKINGLAFVPASGAAGYGSLMVFGKNRTEGVRADIAQRDLWPDFPGFIQPVLLSTGAIGQFCLVEINQDLYWRDGFGGIRSLRSAASEEVNGPGNSPLSREVARITDYESVKRLDACSAIQLNNRLLMTASPFINIHGTTSYRNLISLDFAPLSAMRSKAPPAYDGQWEGINFVRLVQGEFRGERRGFALSTDNDGSNRLWEIEDNGTSDNYYTCIGTSIEQFSLVPMVIETPRRSFNNPTRRKRLERCDVYISGLQNQIELDVYWRADNYQLWSAWDSVSACAKMTDPSSDVPHVWKNIVSQERPQVMTYSIPEGMNEIIERALHVGFAFQVRVVLTGKGRVDKIVMYASLLDEEQFADRTANLAECIVSSV